jgi:hypothetical protein
MEQKYINISEILGFRTLSIIQVLKDKIKEEHDVSETVRPQAREENLLCGVP